MGTCSLLLEVDDVRRQERRCSTRNAQVKLARRAHEAGHVLSLPFYLLFKLNFTNASFKKLPSIDLQIIGRW